MQKEFANFNDMALVCIPVEILLTAKIPAHNVVTSEEMEQCGCNGVCEECRKKTTRQRGAK